MNNYTSHFYVHTTNYMSNFYFGPVFKFSNTWFPFPNLKIPEDLRCPLCEKAHMAEFYINTCIHHQGPRADGVPAVPWVELR